MHEINDSLIVIGKGSIITTSFDRPLSVAGKSIAVKSVGFNSIDDETEYIRYKVRVVDSKDVIHTLSLPNSLWLTSDELVQAIFDEFNNLYEKLNAGEQRTYIVGDDGVEKIYKPTFRPHQGAASITAINYFNSGFRIKDDGYYPSEDNVFSLLKSTHSISDDRRFGYRSHALKRPPKKSITRAPKKSSPVLLFCDAIRPTYTNGVKRRILDVLHHPPSNDDNRYCSNSIVQFHKFSVENLMNISFYFQHIDGTILNFKRPIVIHLIVQ